MRLIKNAISVMLIVFMIISMFPLMSFASSFADVPQSHWAHDAVDLVTNKGFMTGTSSTYFSPNQNTSRAETVMVLAQMFGVNIPDVPGVPVDTGFTDVLETNFYARYIKWACGRGIVSGRGNNTFQPNAPVTRQEFCVILYALFNAYKLNFNVERPYGNFVDESSIADWAKNAVKTVYRADIIGTTATNTFSPTANVTRAQLAVMVANTYMAYIANLYEQSSLKSNNVWLSKTVIKQW